MGHGGPFAPAEEPPQAAERASVAGEVEWETPDCPKMGQGWTPEYLG